MLRPFVFIVYEKKKKKMNPNGFQICFGPEQNRRDDVDVWSARAKSEQSRRETITETVSGSF